MATGSAADQSDPDLLIAIIDCNPLSWHAISDRAPLAAVLHDLFVFFNAFRALQASNELIVIGAHATGAAFLFGDEPGQNVAAVVKERMANLPTAGAGVTQLSSAMSLAMCYIRRVHQEQSAVRPRMLVVQAVADVSAQYTATMNAIFSAQKLSVPVDVVVLTGGDSLLLQQATHLSQGIYHRVGNPGADLLPILLMLFLSGAFDRLVMSMPAQAQIDYRATCFCHKQVQDSGYTCPVCLSVFCKPSLSCPTCMTRFPRPVRKPRLPVIGERRSANMES